MSNDFGEYHFEVISHKGPCIVFEDRSLHGTKIDFLIEGEWKSTHIMYIKALGMTIARLNGRATGVVPFRHSQT